MPLRLPASQAFAAFGRGGLLPSLRRAALCCARYVCQSQGRGHLERLVKNHCCRSFKGQHDLGATWPATLRGKWHSGGRVSERVFEKPLKTSKNLWEPLKTSQALWKPLKTSEDPPSQRSSQRPSQRQISLSEPLRACCPQSCCPLKLLQHWRCQWGPLIKVWLCFSRLCKQVIPFRTGRVLWAKVMRWASSQLHRNTERSQATQKWLKSDSGRPTPKWVTQNWLRSDSGPHF